MFSEEASIAHKKKLTLQRLNNSANKTQQVQDFKSNAVSEMKVEAVLESSRQIRRPSQPSATNTSSLPVTLSRGMLGMPRNPLVSIVSDSDHPTSSDPYLNVGRSIETSSTPILHDTDVDSDRFLSSPEDPRGTEYDLSDRSLLCGAVDPRKSEV